jgi:hypothetical protein
MHSLVRPRSQIIIRARQGHLVQEFRANNSVLTPRLTEEIYSAWKDYIRSEVNKGLLGGEKIVEGEEEDAWKVLSQKVQDSAWKQECLKRYEKFDMAFSAAVHENFRPVNQRNHPLTQILTSSEKRSRQSKKLVGSWSLGKPRTQTRRIGLSMSPVGLLQDT